VTQSRPGALAAHLPSLDGVRGAAILMVLFHNLLVVEEPVGLLNRAIRLGLDTGWVGVQLFFVLSGFLITRVLLGSKGSRDYFASFFARRALRIFPLYYSALLAAFVLWPLLGGQPRVLAEDSSWGLWFYLSNWTGPLGLGGESLPHFWSLAVEEQFYLFWPLVVLRLGARRLLQTCLALAVLSGALREVMVLAAVSPEVIYSITPCRLDALALGAALAAWIEQPGALQRLQASGNRCLHLAMLVTLVGLFATHAFPRTTPIGQTLGYALLSIIFTLALAAAVAGEGASPSRWARWLRFAPLRLCGKYSYGMYVLHKPIHDFVGRPALRSLGLASTHSVLVAVVYLGAATLVVLAAAWLSYELFERHFLALKPRFVARP
jgi:peptidoglycan/LPS O-acetylase OafA/YrhL